MGSEHRELRQGSREGVPPGPPLRLVCTGAGEHPSQMVKGGASLLGGAKQAASAFTLNQCHECVREKSRQTSEHLAFRVPPPGNYGSVQSATSLSLCHL